MSMLMFPGIPGPFQAYLLKRETTERRPVDMLLFRLHGG